MTLVLFDLFIAGSSQKLAGVQEKMDMLSIKERDSTKSRGTLGRKIPIETNHLPMQLDRIVPTAYHYDVTIDPDKPRRMMRKVWETFRRKNFPNIHPAFDDSKNLYTTEPIPEKWQFGELELPEEEFDKPKKYTIVLKFANTIDMRALLTYVHHQGRSVMPQEALMCLDIVLRNASALRFVRVQRNYFSQPTQMIDLGSGMELWHGFFQSAILGWKPYLNVDVTNKGFPKEINIVDLMAEISRQPARNMSEIQYYDSETISKHIKGLKVRYEIPKIPSSKRSIRCNKLLSTNAENTKFEDQNGVEATVYDYFLKIKNYRIQYPKLPLVWVGPSNKKLYLPAELCTILPGQVTQKRLNDQQTRVMVKNATTSTDVRKAKIIDTFKDTQLNNDPCVKAFGISIASQFEQITARVLDPPTLTYSDRNVKPFKGVWRGEKFRDGKNLTNWRVLNLSRRIQDKEIDYFCDLMKKAGFQCQMNIEPVRKPHTHLQARDLRRAIQQFFNENKTMDLIIVIVPDRPADIYAQVKQQAELVVGCLTQCIKEITIQRRMDQATVGNILLKVNAKLNGVNHVLSSVSRPRCLQEPCMIMGADVNHPSPDQKDRPSYAAVTASHDPNAVQYNICWRLQTSAKEIIVDLENIVYEHLEFFYKKTNGKKPKKIIFFRDGVSEGQFREVLTSELMAIRRACKRMQATDFEPAITFLVVQKRHHTRFFPKNPRDSEDRNNNVPAGTCVDTDIIHPSDMEYYLVSHASIQGVARPTKYRMLWDDNQMSDDEIQTLTYYLCHLFTRCNRSVSYPAPTYYAHLAAARAHAYFEGKDVNMADLSREQDRNKIKVEICKQKPMFFV